MGLCKNKSTVQTLPRYGSQPSFKLHYGCRSFPSCLLFFLHFFFLKTAFPLSIYILRPGPLEPQIIFLLYQAT